MTGRRAYRRAMWWSVAAFVAGFVTFTVGAVGVDVVRLPLALVMVLCFLKAGHARGVADCTATHETSQLKEFSR